MADLTIIRCRGLTSVTVQSDSDAGAEFVDSWMPDKSDEDYHVVDSGWIVVAGASVLTIEKAAKDAGLSVENEEDA